MRRLQKFFALSPEERRMLLAALGGLPLVAACLRLSGYARTRSWLALADAPSMPAAPDRRAEAERVARLVGVAARHGLVKGSCLSRAILISRMLQRRGIAAEIRFGARADGALVEAHAWVEQDGQPLEDGFIHQAFTELEPAAGAEEPPTRPLS